MEEAQASDKDFSEIPLLMQLTPQQLQSLVLETWRTMGINGYHQRDYVSATAAFSVIAEDTTLPLGTTLRAKEWKQRCQWAQNRF